MSWTCATCGQQIIEVDHAWIEWLYDRRERNGYGLRLVHHRIYGPHAGVRTYGCCYSPDLMADYGCAVLDAHLSSFIRGGRASLHRLKEYGPEMQIAAVERAINAGLPPKKAKPRPRSKTSSKWDDSDPVGVKRQRLVKWLMSRPRCVPLDDARRIAVRKYPC